jgi:hypothetical protein
LGMRVTVALPWESFQAVNRRASVRLSSPRRAARLPRVEEGPPCSS